MYVYDAAGNLLTLSKWNGTEVESVRYVYNSANQIKCVDGNANQVCGDAADTAYTYDAYGNLTSDGTSTYTYDAANRLISVTSGASTTTYTYNGDGDRVSQTVDSTLTTYVLDTATSLTMVLAETTGSESFLYIHAGTQLIAQSDGATTLYHLRDGLGSTRQLVDSTGAPLLSQTFDPYGSLYLSAGSGESSFGWAGEVRDSNGLTYLRARYYSPIYGRFLNTDPSRQENNPYSYATSDPINATDPTGLRTSTIKTYTVMLAVVNCRGGLVGHDTLDFLPMGQVICRDPFDAGYALGTIIPNAGSGDLFGNS
jgi:RHS repeat-associated protein